MSNLDPTLPNIMGCHFTNKQFFSRFGRSSLQLPIRECHAYLITPDHLIILVILCFEVHIGNKIIKGTPRPGIFIALGNPSSKVTQRY